MSHHNLFLSHSWKYSDAYDGLVTLLNNREDRDFTYSNYSVPKDDPIHNAANDLLLKAAIRAQMVRCSKIIILAGVYATYSKWINIEIQLAKEMGKKIIAVQPWGAEKTSTVVKNNADRVITWNSRSLVNAIKEL
mgnify:CR=1 FL=1